MRPGHAIVLCVVALLTLGIVMVTSAGLTIDAPRPVSVIGILTSRPALYAVAAVVAMLVGSLVNPAWLAKRWNLWHPAIWLLVACIVLLALVHVQGIGREVNGARRWLSLGAGSWTISFQPSELAKWSLILILASYAVRKGPHLMSRFRSGLAPGLGITMIIVGLVIVEDLGTAVLIGAVALLLLYAAGTKLHHIGMLIPIPAAMVLAAIATSPYRLTRIRSFLDPYADPQGDGYHMIQSMVTIAGGHVTGRGLGHGVYKFGYLPEDTTDFLFAVICEELGIFGAAVVLLLYVALILAGLIVIRKQTADIARLIGLGIIATLGLQTLINLLVVTGLAPTKGIALPLLSAGGTGWILTAFSLGILVGMDRRADRALSASGQAAVARPAQRNPTSADEPEAI